jgi:tRNA nucleotidyltransferase (CCA-adding enzyme)
MSKTLEQIKQDASTSRQDFLKELKEVREYQAKHPSVKKSVGGYVIDLGPAKGTASKNQG